MSACDLKANLTKKPMTFWVSQERPHGHRYFFGAFTLKRLICQSFSAFSASSLKNVSAVSCSHSLSESVLFFSLSFLGLICSEHYCHLLGICSEACCFSAFSTLLHNDILYYKHKMLILSSVFDDFFIFFFYIYHILIKICQKTLKIHKLFFI